MRRLSSPPRELLDVLADRHVVVAHGVDVTAANSLADSVHVDASHLVSRGQGWGRSRHTLASMPYIASCRVSHIKQNMLPLQNMGPIINAMTTCAFSGTTWMWNFTPRSVSQNLIPGGVAPWQCVWCSWCTDSSFAHAPLSDAHGCQAQSFPLFTIAEVPPESVSIKVHPLFPVLPLGFR